MDPSRRSFTIIAGDFVKTGGMDRANFALADYLVRHGHRVDLVGHRVAPELASRAGVRFVRVPKPFDSYVLGEPLLDRVGRHAARVARDQGGIVVINGGNSIAPGVNWAHYVHASYVPRLGSGPRAMVRKLVAARSRYFEARAFRLAELVITNSVATRRAVVEELGVDASRVFVVYLGLDTSAFAPVDDEEKSRRRAALGWSERPVLAFVGPLTDRRKGFDTLIDAWARLCREPSWDVDLAAIGAGSERLRGPLAERGLAERVKLLGFRSDIPRVLAACDGLVAPTRYEAFGLGVAEALATGLAAVVSASAGVAELYPEALSDLLLTDPESADELTEKLRRWRERLPEQQARIAALCARVRARTWDVMAAEFVSLAERHSS